jgi:hypothetical protein
MTRLEFDFAEVPMADLGARFRVIAAVSAAPVSLCIAPDYLRQIAARLDRSLQLEAEAAGLHAQIAALTDDGIRLRHRCAGVALWALGAGLFGGACLFGLAVFVALLIGLWP